jgi:uncharacterized protein (TIGR03086 family)
MDTYAALDAAVATAAPVIKGIGADQLDNDTPCAQWSVRDVVNHLLGTCWLGEGMFGDETPRHAVVPGGLPDGDLAGADPAAAYAEASAALLASASQGDTLARMHTTPLGEMPGAVLAGFTTLDLVMHGWDLAKATGQSFTVDDDLVAHLDGFARQAVGPEVRGGGLIGPEVDAPAKASTVDRLAAFLGRTP